MVTAFGMVHSRFSTNTLGSWRLAHPYRMLAHNGEINTVRGNRNWMAAREKVLQSDYFGEDIEDVTPVCEADEPSDTASLDNSFEFLRMGGRSLEHVAAMMLPAAWYGNESMPDEVKAFYEFHGGMMEPWDGPAMITFTDGHSLGAVLDRNGLRPFRYWVTKSNLLVMASEAGVLDIPPDEIAYRERLEPGRLFLVDFDQQRIVPSEKVIGDLASRRPYAEWLEDNRLTLEDLLEPDAVPGVDMESLVTRQMIFGYSLEDLKWLIGPMAIQGSQPNGSMGNDVPLAVLSDRPQVLFSYFKQKFAQVSNPPLDPIREKLVTQMAVPIGRRPNLLDETAEHARVLRIDHPLLFNRDLARIKMATNAGLKAKTISTLFPVSEGTDGLADAIQRIRNEASDAIEDGCTILILSDRGVDSDRAFIPSLLATAAVHHHLIREQTRPQADIIVESGEPREVHHFATLYGYGASAVNPYLAFESIAGMRAQPTVEHPLPAQVDAEQNFRYAVESGVLKTMAKMGISTLQGYIGAQAFEALGLSEAVTDEYFRWTESRIGGVDLEDLALDVLANHARAYPEGKIPGNLRLDLGGIYLWRGTGEQHMWNPDTVALLQDAATRNDRAVFQQFEVASDNEGSEHITIRNMLEFIDNPNSVPIDEVEPTIDIVKRFATGAISLGSISREAHETLAIAMNRIGARSNTGEGGEDPARYTPDSNGDRRVSAVKQVASGRFGVNTNYLVNSTDLQIKMAQGAKPGEGGELPGWKVSDYIAFIRKTTRGVELISPPPHHDIYSIEDLAQLIHDLKNVTPESRVHVKLVAVAGVGIIAAGVAKGKADVVLISGDSGGTGASPLSSIRHGGIPWELGLAETQQVLVENGLRDRIVIQTDGQIKTSRDVVIAALLGADEWGVATASLITMGCIMLRKCHLNICSVGVATQDPELRARFDGTPEAVVNYFMMLADGVRETMAKLGFRTVNEMIGRTDVLKQRGDLTHWKAKKLDLSRMLMKPTGLPGDHPYHCVSQDHALEQALDHELIRLSQGAIERCEKVRATLDVKNRNRAVGAMLSGKIAQKYGEDGLPDGTINFTMRGSGGQSFGAFAVRGVTFRLEGDANDYLGKGLSGGRIVVVPPEGSSYVPEENIIIGNVALYGATGGEAYIRGRGGERFCVRNSDAHAVIEGIGDHGCEYMTGGRVVVLGSTGRNFAAGMSGGVAYVWDPDRTFIDRFNPELADLLDVDPGSVDEAELRTLISNHLDYTGSMVAKNMLAEWRESLTKFRKIFPKDYARVLREEALAVANSALTNGATHHSESSVTGVGVDG
jgi:glutamate synthase (NADPH/NADH) large chain